MSKKELDRIRQYLDQAAFDDLRFLHVKTNNFYLYNRDGGLWDQTIPAMAFPEPLLSELTWSTFKLAGNCLSKVQLENVSAQKHSRSSSADVFKQHEPLKHEVLASLLYSSFGQHGEQTRPYPSSGALYSVQTIIVPFKQIAENINAGNVYHYVPAENTLEQFGFVDVNRITSSIFGSQDHPLANADFIVVYAMLAEKFFVKYRFRGYRLALTEIGAMYQQASLIAETVGLKTRVWGGFDDHYLAKLLNFDSRVLWPGVIQLFGR